LQVDRIAIKLSEQDVVLVLLIKGYCQHGAAQWQGEFFAKNTSEVAAWFEWQTWIVIVRLGHHGLQQRAIAAFAGFDMNRVERIAAEFKLSSRGQCAGVCNLPLARVVPTMISSLERNHRSLRGWLIKVAGIAWFEQRDRQGIGDYFLV
jgi:hypothetical protein